MESQENIINRDLIIGWASIVTILFVAYFGEVLKGERTWIYLIVFMVFTGLPALVVGILYKMNPSSHSLRYHIIVGYFFMYTFVMITGSTTLVFTYIFPLLSFIILYHQQNLILGMGIAAFIMNIIFIVIRAINHQINMSNSKEIEIQIALLFLCFAGSYAAAGLYGDITKKNREYVKILDEKTKQIQKMTFQAINTIANTIDAKDEYTKGHSQRVSEYSYALARELGLKEEEAENVRRIALLHDIGKIGVPDSVLNKPGRLTEEEYEIMKSHPVVGAGILKDIKMLKDLDVGAKYHHERYDGKGYPSGLKGEEIPYIARIIGVADSYDAMSSNRVYRKRFSEDKILEELERCKGTQFDPQVADAFIRLIKKKELKNLSPDIVSANEAVEVRQDEKLNESISIRQSEKSVIEELASIGHIKKTEKDIVLDLKERDGCLILIDVDNIGEINKKYGYLCGDYCLMVIAGILMKPERNLRVARVDGDEFICFVSGIGSIMDAEKYVMDLMNIIHSEIVRNKELEDITISSGVSLSAISGRDYSRLYTDADKALYHIKQQNGNGFYIYNDTRKAESKYISKNDLDNLVKIIQEEYSYTGALQLNYNEFEKIYEFVRNIGRRNAQTIQLILFTIRPLDEKHFAVEDRANVMQYVESAIIDTVRSVDITTRYSSTQQLVMFINLENSSIQMVIDRIMKEFYRMYDKKNVALTYDVANLNFDKNDN